MISPWDKIGEYAEKRLVQLSRKIKTLIAEHDYQFDLVISSGNSGIGTVEILKLVYEKLEIKTPPVIQIPIYRYYPEFDGEKLFDNLILLPMVKSQISTIENIETVLFLDDEIGKGTTAKESLKLISEAVGNKDITYVIVAEDRGFVWESPYKNVKVEFIPYAKEVEGLYNILSYITPYEIESEVRKYFDDKEIPSKQLMNCLFGQPSKEFNNGKPVFSNKYCEMIKSKVESFENSQEVFQKLISNKVGAALDIK